MAFNQFDKAFNRFHGSDRISEYKEIFGVNSKEEVKQIAVAIRDRSQIVKHNIDMSKIIYEKRGTNEHKAKRYMGDETKVFKEGITKTGEELLKDYSMYDEIQPPAFIEDFYGNIWWKVSQS